MKRVACYLRVSTTEQTVENQRTISVRTARLAGGTT